MKKYPPSSVLAYLGLCLCLGLHLDRLLVLILGAGGLHTELPVRVMLLLALHRYETAGNKRVGREGSTGLGMASRTPKVHLRTFLSV